MATYVPAKRATAYRTWVSLVARATRPQFKVNPTLAAGDVKVSKDGGALANLTTLPAVTPAGSVLVQMDLSATEMTADIVTVVFSDAAGAEWDDAVLVIPTVARQIDDLAFPAVSGRSLTVDANGRVDLSAWLGVAVNALLSGRVDASVGAMAANVLTAAAINAAALTAAKFATDAIDANALAANAADEIVAKILANPANKLFTFGDGSVEVGQNNDKEQVLSTVLEGTLTTAQLLRIILAATAGKANGFPAGPAHYRDQADTKNRITATVDADGNRSVVTVDGT